MYKTNFHSHCVFCDGRAPMEVFIQHAIAKGLDAYGVSSHAPVPFVTRWAMDQEDLQDYLQEFSRLQKRYEDQIDLYVGLELDYLPDDKDVVFKKHIDVPLDYRIGSVHYTKPFPDGRFWNVDCETSIYKKAVKELYGGDLKRTITEYFNQTCEMIESCEFQVLGHMDKMSRNANQFDGFSVEEKWYMDLMFETLSLVKEKGIIVEINTKSLLTKGYTYPNKEFFPMLKGMKVPVMVNSDAHLPDMVVSGMHETYGALLTAGIETVRVLKKGEWVDEKIVL